MIYERIGLNFSRDRGELGPIESIFAINIFVFSGTSKPASLAISLADFPTILAFKTQEFLSS